MKTLLTILGFLLIVYGEDTDTVPGYFYPSPSIQESPQTNSLTENIDINRFVYFFKAPPSEKKPIKKPVINIPPPKKNYKIIFIQAPEPPTPVLPELPVIPKDEEKTIVYVLNKKHEEQPTVFLPTPKPTKPTAPEVYFINYGLQKNSTSAEHHPQVSGEPYEAATTDESPRQYITPSSPSFEIPSQYLPPASQYSLQDTVDIPAEAIPKESGPSSRYLPPKTSYGVPIEEELLNKTPEKQPTVFLPTPESTKRTSPEVYFMNDGLQENRTRARYHSQVVGELEPPETDKSSKEASSSPSFNIPSQYLPPALQYGLQGTLDIPAEAVSKESGPSSKYLPHKTYYGVPREDEVSSKSSTKNSYGEPIETYDSYQGQVRNSRSALKTVEGSGAPEPFVYFQRKSAV